MDRVGQRDDHDPSFDPRFWGAPQPLPSRGPDDGDPSFDPRTWFSAEGAPPPPPAPDRRSEKVGRPAVRSGPVSWPVAIATGAAIAGLGAWIAWAARPAAVPREGVRAAPAAVSTAAPPPALSSRTVIVPGMADLAPNLLAAGVVPADATAIARHATATLGADPGDLRLTFDYVEAQAATGGRAAIHPRHVVISRPDGAGIVLTLRDDGSFASERQAAHLTRKLDFVRGELDAQSFYSSAVAAGVSDVLVSDFANAFQFDFDFQREIKPGDIIEAGFEQSTNENGETVGTPVLVYAALSTAAKSRALYRFQPPGEVDPEWFDHAGRSTKRALMRTPVEAVRISSGFGMRGHPILGYVKMHRGTDFAAPTGTPIYAAGDGAVVFAGPKGPNGNFVKLHHDNGWDTLYLHMNRIWPGVSAGARVVQGQQIGEVGTTGRSTGPHLHYEVHIAGQPVDPLSIDTGTGRTLSGAAMAAFRKVRDAIDTRRAAIG